jgi:hypothetical protein
MPVRSIARFDRACRVALAALALIARAAAAQQGQIARADSAFAADDRNLARQLYESALVAHPNESRVVFRLAGLERRADRALALYERYVTLEPRDPWGYMALGDQLSRMGRSAAAIAAYDHAAALAPGERDVALGRARVLERAGRGSEARAVLAEWAAGHQEDAEAWDLLGRASMRAGRPRAAADAFARADAAGGASGIRRRLQLARAQSGPAAEPIAGYQRDSDGNAVTRAGVALDAMVADGVRVGVSGERGSISDAFESVRTSSGSARLDARLATQLRFDALASLTSFGGAASGAWTSAQGDVRVRWRAANGGPALDLRAQRLALGSAPLLVEHHVVRHEARATVELPLSRLRVRATTRLGVLQALQELGNQRVETDGVLALPLGSSELSAQYRTISYDHASASGYFAPHRVQSMEGGWYFERGEGGVSVAADVGAGAQRLARQGEALGTWGPSLRGWSYLSIPLGPARALWAEVEAYDAPFPEAGVATSPSWRFVALSAGVRWAIR